MQGIESLNNFKSFVSTLGGLGRFEDTYMVHAAEGETVVPMEVLNQNPLLKERLFESMRDMGIQPERYVVGNELNSINPVTGQPEFFLKKIVSQIRKAMPGDSEKYLGAAVGALTGNPFYGALAGGVGSGAGGALTGGAAGAMLPGFSGLGGQAPNLVGYLKGMAPDKLLSKAGSYLVNPVGRAQDFIGGIKDKPFALPSQMIEGIGSLFTGGRNLLTSGFQGGRNLLTSGFQGAKTLFESLNPFEKGVALNANSIFKKTYEKAVNDGILSGNLKEDQKNPIYAKLYENAIDEASEGSDKSNINFGKLAGLVGLGTLGLGKLIGEPEDITIDPSRLRTAPIDTGQVFSQTQPTTVYTDYNVPITPYQAAEGGIIGYREGGLTGNPHQKRPDKIPLSDEMKDQMYDFLLDFMLKERMREQMENEDREGGGDFGYVPPYSAFDEYRNSLPPMEAANGGIVDFFKSFFTDPVKDPVTREGTVSTIQRKKFEMLNSLKESGLDYDEQEYLRLKELLGKANGGVMDLRGGGASNGPGTGTSDSIPAMLSDGEFVMTAKAVRGAGGGDRREGAKKMYEAMDRLEARG